MVTKNNRTAQKPAHKTSHRTTSSRRRELLTEQLTNRLALAAALDAVPPELRMDSGRDSRVLGRIIATLGREYFELKQARRWIITFKVACGAPAIPRPAAQALRMMIDQIDGEFFRPYVMSALITGVAAGLKGYGRDSVPARTKGGA